VTTTFVRLNPDWNAEPNVPDPRVRVEGADVVLEFVANHYRFRRFAEGRRIGLRFRSTTRYRLGPTNDEGWYRGQCRFSRIAPAWGEFYEVGGDLKLDQTPGGWISLGDSPTPARRHFLFYLRDQTFECSAEDWALET